MRRLFLTFCLLAIALLFCHHGFAQEAAEIADKTADTTPAASALTDDLQKAKELLLGKGGDNPLARGMLLALFQPIFIASMFSLGLWAGQMSERLIHIWILPVFVYAATVIGAFITAYHSNWKPEFDGNKLLASLESTDTVAVLVGLFLGGAVGMRLLVPPVIAAIGAIIVGVILGFSQTGEIGAHSNSLIPFWAGFGLTGLLINIFGIGFETFLESIKLNTVTRMVGFATAIAAFSFGAKLF